MVYQVHTYIIYSVSTNFRLELKEPSAREVSIFWTLVEREVLGRVDREVNVDEAIHHVFKL